MKFCRFVANLYPHSLTDFDLFILIFSKIALIFLGVLIVLTVSSFEFSPGQIAVTSLPLMGGPRFNRPQIHLIIRLVGNAIEFYNKLQPKPKIRCSVDRCTPVDWSALREKAITDSAVKDYR